MGKKNFKDRKRARMQRELYRLYKLKKKTIPNEEEIKKEIYEIYKNVAKICCLSVEEIQQRMKQPVDFMPFIKKEIPTYEEMLVLWLETIKREYSNNS